MRILALTNIPGARVGYGTLAKVLLPEFSKKHKVALMTNWGLEGEQIVKFEDFSGIPVYGKGSQNFNEHLVLPNYRHFEADCLLTIWDAWAFSVILQNATAGELTFTPYFPIDTDVVTRLHRQACQAAFRIIPMSQAGEELFRKEFPEKTMRHVPVGVDTKTFRRLWESAEEKEAFRQELGFQKGKFVIGLAGDIKSTRKRWADNLEGCAAFIRKHPEVDVGIFIHTRRSPETGLDYSMDDIIDVLGLKDHARIIDEQEYIRGVSHEELARIYNGFDVFMQCSAGEGGGMQFIEAQACGTPVIGTDFTSMPQMIDRSTGSLVKPAFVEWNPHLARKAFPSVQGMVEALEKAYGMKGEVEFSDRAREFAMRFDWETVVLPLWGERLAELEADIRKACLRPPEPCAEYARISREVREV